MRNEEENAAKAAKNEYMKQWRKTHKDNVRAINARYWEKKAQQAAAAATGGDDGGDKT